ncbi:MAG: acyltransferase [bacterium]
MTAVRRLGSYLAESLSELWMRPKHQLPALDFVRATAVLTVVAGHFYNTFWRLNMRLPVPPMSNGLVFRYGWTGVDLFFILSGYLIGVQLWKEKKKTGTINVFEFITRRGFRIWPLYYSIILMGTLAHVMRPHLSDMLFVSNYFRAGFPRGWTLSTEEQFYIAVPLLLAFTPWIKKLETYFWVLGAAVVSVWVSRYYACQSIVASGIASCKELDDMITPIHLHNEALVAGLAIALLSVARPHLFARKAEDGFSWRGFFVMGVCFVLAAAMYAADRMIFSFTYLALIFGSVTLWLLWDRSVFSWPASWRIWYPISRLSYGMYLNHFLLFSWITTWVVRGVVRQTGSTTMASYAGIVTGSIVSAIFAVFTFVFVERPFLLLRGRWIEGRKRKKAAASGGQELAAQVSGLP